MNSNAKEEMNPIKEKYKATIIIPAYNAETTIHRAVDSAVNQTTKSRMKYCSWMMDPLTALLIFWMTTLNYIKTSVPSTRKTRVLPEQERMLPLLLLALISSGLMPMIMPMKSFLKKHFPHWKREMMLSYTVSIHLGRMGVSKKKNQSSEQNYS